MILQRFEVPGLAHYSYLIASDGHAVVVDPQRDVAIYVDFARTRGVSIDHVVESHIHADYASGAPALAVATGATLWLSGHDKDEQFEYAMPHSEIRDGNEVHFGKLKLVAVHTPGHTPEHLSFLLYERQGCGQPLGIFSGDFLLIGSLGRPDLLGESEKQALAAQLFHSAQTRIADVPDGTIVYPGHGAGSLCGVGIAERPESTIGYERQCNPFMIPSTQDSFVSKILGSVPQFPPYYKRMKELNSKGFPTLDRLPGAASLTAAETMRELAQGALVLDVRSADAFGGLHIPGSFNIGAGPNLSLWAGWVLPYEGKILLVGDDSSGDLLDVRKSLIRVGHDEAFGYLRGGINAWIAAGLEQAHLPQISVGELQKAALNGEFILDVRSPAEWKSAHIASAVHIPLGDLSERFDEIPRDATIHVICGSGYRSSIACSLLQRASFPEIRNTMGGMAAWFAQKLPTIPE